MKGRLLFALEIQNYVCEKETVEGGNSQSKI